MLIRQMFELQQSLNDQTNGKIWLTGKTQEGRKINWHRCIYMEAVEALDSFNWKHWKDINSTDDIDNIKVEIVDIWHFVMSEAIIHNQQNYADNYQHNPTNFNREQLIISLEKLVHLSSNYQNIKTIIDEFFNCLNFAGITIKELYKRYIIKNQLNKFRQDNGYKNSTYQKMWQGIEDNVVAFEIMNQYPEIGANELYQKLTEKYQAIF